MVSTCLASAALTNQSQSVTHDTPNLESLLHGMAQKKVPANSTSLVAQAVDSRCGGRAIEIDARATTDRPAAMKNA